MSLPETGRTSRRSGCVSAFTPRRSSAAHANARTTLFGRRLILPSPPVQLSVCGLPALVWQRHEHTSRFRPLRLALVADTAAVLPVLDLQHRSGVLGDRTGRPQPTGVAALDAAYRAAGDLAAWAPVPATPTVQQALLGVPLDSLGVSGGRITLVSRDGVYLDADATVAIAQVAAALISAIPPHLAPGAGAHPAPPN